MFSRSPARSGGLGFAGLVLVSILVQCGPRALDVPFEPSHPRAGLFGMSDSAIAELLQAKDRISVLFYPGAGQCRSQELAAIRALRRIGESAADIRVLTVLPASLKSELRFGEAPPGEVVRVRDEHFRAQASIAPTPRLEVWSGTGQLLLMRSLPSNVREDEIHEQVLWSRSFTKPM